MNKFICSGRFVNDLSVRQSENGNMYMYNKLAIDRTNAKNEQKKADFIPVVFFGKLAELVKEHCVKGQKVMIVGKIEDNTREEDGYYFNEFKVIVEEIEFGEKPKKQKE